MYKVLVPSIMTQYKFLWTYGGSGHILCVCGWLSVKYRHLTKPTLSELEEFHCIAMISVSIHPQFPLVQLEEGERRYRLYTSMTAGPSPNSNQRGGKWALQCVLHKTLSVYIYRLS